MVKTVENDVGSEPIRIRAHHLLCMQGFQGYGYNKDFTVNLAKITEKFQTNPSTFLEIVNAPDSICEHCPHYSKGACNMDASSERRIRVMDNLLLQNLEIREGSVISWAEIKSSTFNLNKQTIKEICGSCFWRSKCAYFQQRGL
jgi:uncharacterized protein